MMKLPAARTADLVEQDAGAELLIYNTKTDKTYLLNETSKNVFSACAKNLTSSELKRRYRYTDDLIYYALAELRANELIEGSEAANYFAGLSRRAIIKRVSLSSLAALPVIAALTAPTAANASSVCPDPNSYNIPSGCQAGVSFIRGGSCADQADAISDSRCNNFMSSRCQSRKAVYRQGSCKDEGANFRISCVCA